MEGFVTLNVRQIKDGQHEVDARAELTNVGLLEKAALISAFLQAINVESGQEAAMIMLAGKYLDQKNKGED